ncbi:MAG TPA: BON domain-containing protein [Terriglobales bacterium]|nr:BON domain-containing protein [Terriglobales bacterium]
MSKRLLTLTVALLMLAFAVACSQQRANAPSHKDAVENALKSGGYDNVNVDEDRDKRVITLKGDVRSEEDKARAAQLAQNAANGMVVANELGVRPEGDAGDQAKTIDKNTDDAIESHMKAAIAAHNWDNQHISYDAKNGVLTLTGDVDTSAQREQVQKVAKDIPGVQQVVNELEVKGNAKNSAARRKAAGR